MTDTNPDFRLEWQPPPRPEWVARVNEEGYWMDIRGVVPLDEKSLLETAMRNTGLSDFGADDWREPFQVLAKAMEAEAELNLIGRLRTRSELLQLLEARLQIEDTYKKHPEIEEEQIVQPIFIVGQGRSGTSFLVNTLSKNPDFGALLEWEAMFPCPPPEKATYESDPRIEKSHKLIDQWNRVTPTLASMHEFAGNVPMEDCQILALNFMAPSWFGSLGQTPAYDTYMTGVDPKLALNYEKRVLKLLQWKNPRKHWVLKDPIHLDRLEALMSTFPDACLIWPHRDPVKALSSTVSLLGTIQWGRSDHPFKGGSFEYVLNPEFSAARFDAVIEKLEAGVVPPTQIYHMLYKDLVADTLGALDTCFNQLKIPLSEIGRGAIKKYLEDNPRTARPAHMIQKASSEALNKARKAYQHYQEYFNVPVE